MKKWKKVLKKIGNGLKQLFKYIAVSFSYIFRVLFRRRPWNTMKPEVDPFSPAKKLVLIDKEDNPELYEYTKQQIREKQQMCRDHPNLPECRHSRTPYL